MPSESLTPLLSGTVYQTPGTILTGEGDLVSRSVYQFSGGTWSGTGYAYVYNVIYFTGAIQKTIVDRRVVIYDVLRWQQGFVSFTGQSSFTNAPGGTVYFEHAADANWTAAGSFFNNGTILKSTAVTIYLNVYIVQTVGALFNADNGTVYFTTGGALSAGEPCCCVARVLT
jgi:hypothetical protein